MRFYRINTRNEVSGPLTAEELVRKYKRRAIDENTPCQSTETRVWQTIGHYFPGFELGNFRPLSIEDRRASRVVSPLAWLFFGVLIAAAAVTAWWNLRGLPDSGRSVTADSFPSYAAIQPAPQLYAMPDLQQQAPPARQQHVSPAQPLYVMPPAPRPTPKTARNPAAEQRRPSSRRTVVNASEPRRTPVPTYFPPSIPARHEFQVPYRKAINLISVGGPDQIVTISTEETEYVWIAFYAAEDRIKAGTRYAKRFGFGNDAMTPLRRVQGGTLFFVNSPRSGPGKRLMAFEPDR